MIGRLLDGRYKILRILGAGGFSQTYLALDTRRPSSPTCVVKHLRPNSDDPGSLQIARRLFRSEAETLERIGDHDQIPRLLAYFEEEQEFYLVQEFIEGHVLTAELQSDVPMAEAEVVSILCDVLSTLAFVHSQGVIHRDVKPDNLIRRTEDGKLVLVDFGAVKTVWSRPAALQGQRGGTVAGTIIGTPGYMSTEQGRGKPRPSSDIYALGMLGVQALTGLNPIELQEDPRTGEPQWQEHTRVSPQLGAILSKMVSYHFKDRYQSAAEALEALRPLASSHLAPYTANPLQPQTLAPSESTQPPSVPPRAEIDYSQSTSFIPEKAPVEPPVADLVPSTREETYYDQLLPFIAQSPEAPTHEKLHGEPVLNEPPNREQMPSQPPIKEAPAVREMTDDGQPRTAGGRTNATSTSRPMVQEGNGGNKTLVFAGASIAAAAAVAAIGFFVLSPSTTQTPVPTPLTPSTGEIPVSPVKKEASVQTPSKAPPVKPPETRRAVVQPTKPAPLVSTTKPASSSTPAPRPPVKAAMIKLRPVTPPRSAAPLVKPGVAAPRPKPQPATLPKSLVVKAAPKPRPTPVLPKSAAVARRPQPAAVVINKLKPAKVPTTGGLRPASALVTGSEALPEGLRPAASPLGTPR